MFGNDGIHWAPCWPEVEFEKKERERKGLMDARGYGLGAYFIFVC